MATKPLVERPVKHLMGCALNKYFCPSAKTWLGLKRCEPLFWTELQQVSGAVKFYKALLTTTFSRPLQLNGTLAALALITAPRVVMQLVCLIFRCVGELPMDLDMVEYFAGEMAVTRSWARSGYNCAPFEIRLLPFMDILSPQGFLPYKSSVVALGPVFSCHGPNLFELQGSRWRSYCLFVFGVGDSA